MRLLFLSNQFHIFYFTFMKMNFFSCYLNSNYSTKMNYSKHFGFQIQIHWNKKGPSSITWEVKVSHGIKMRKLPGYFGEGIDELAGGRKNDDFVRSYHFYGDLPLLKIQ